MSEAWQRDPRTVTERLVERGSVYDVDALETIYDDDQYLVFVETGGSIRRLGREENLALFREWAKSGATPLLPEAELLHIEEARDNAIVLLRRRMHANEPSRLYELRLRKSGDIWKVSGETVTPWPGAHDVPSDMEKSTAAVADAPQVGETSERRREIIRQYFHRVDARDPALFDLCTDDVELVYPKFGTHRGKAAMRAFGARMGAILARLEHDIDGLRFVDSGDTIVVEGREWGELADGTPFPDGSVSQGRFCNVFTFEGDLIASVRIYVDPDLASNDDERVRLFRAGEV
jgi:ketosteroid isomerase-like protein